MCLLIGTNDPWNKAFSSEKDDDAFSDTTKDPLRWTWTYRTGRMPALLLHSGGFLTDTNSDGGTPSFQTSTASARVTTTPTDLWAQGDAALFRQDRYVEAEAIFRRIMADDPTNGHHARIRLGQALQRQKRFNEARAAIEPLTPLLGELSATLQAELATLFYDLGDRAMARVLGEYAW